MTDRTEKLIAYYTGKQGPCTHPFRHTVYGSDDPDGNGTWCAICGERL